MNRTLPLFEELPSPPAADPPPEAAPARAPATADADKHLRAAWRLSRAMRRLPDRSPEQTRAGLAICHHLQALLGAADEGVARRESPPAPR